MTARFAAPISERRMFGMGLRLAAASLFATMAMLIKLVGEAGVELTEILFWRQFGALPLTLLWILLGPGLSSLRTSRPGAHFGRAVIGMICMMLGFWSLLLLPLAEATTLGFCAPLFATILAIFMLKERVGVHRWSAVALGFVGVLIVLQPGGSKIPALGALAGLVAALLVALVSIQIKDLTRTEPTPTIAFHFAFFSAIPLGAMLPFFATDHDAREWALLIAIGSIGAIAQLCMTGSLRHAPVSTVIGFDYFSLIWAIFYGWLIWDHVPPAATWIGAPIIIASGLYIAWREHVLSIERTRELAA